MRYHRDVHDVAATCIDRSIAEAGLRNLGASWNPAVPGAFAGVLERALLRAELDGTAQPTETSVCFTGAAQAMADLLQHAATRNPNLGDAPLPPTPFQIAPLAGVTGWTAVGATIAALGITFGPVLADKIRKATRARTKKRRRR